MVLRRVFFLCLLAFVVLAVPHSFAVAGAAAPATPTFTLWQLPEQTRIQMMSYVLRTANGKVRRADLQNLLGHADDQTLAPYQTGAR